MVRVRVTEEFGYNLLHILEATNPLTRASYVKMCMTSKKEQVIDAKCRYFYLRGMNARYAIHPSRLRLTQNGRRMEGNRWRRAKEGSEDGRERKKERKWEALEGRGYRYALVPLKWSLYTSHKTRLAPYTSSLHVKGRLLCPGLTAHLTCLEWKKWEISLPPSRPSPPSCTLPRLNKPISRAFLLQRRLLYTRAK